jgi:hypothetical protein
MESAFAEERAYGGTKRDVHLHHICTNVPLTSRLTGTKHCNRGRLAQVLLYGAISTSAGM